MRAKDLYVGEVYWAEYRPHISSNQAYSDKILLLDKNYPLKGWHRCQTLDDGSVVFASSRGISHKIDTVKVPVGHQNNFTTRSGKVVVRAGNNVLPVKSFEIDMDELITPIRAEVDRLRQLGYDDATRSKELVKICEMMEGLGVRVKRLPDDVGISIAWADLAVLTTLVQKLYLRDMMEFEE